MVLTADMSTLSARKRSSYVVHMYQSVKMPHLLNRCQ